MVSIYAISFANKNITTLGFSSINIDAIFTEKFENNLIQQIIDSKYFSYIDRKNLIKTLKEQELQATGITDSVTAVKFGKIMNVDYIIYGSAEKKKIFSLKLVMVDVETSKVVNTYNDESTELDILINFFPIKALKILSFNIIEKNKNSPIFSKNDFFDNLDKEFHLIDTKKNIFFGVQLGNSLEQVQKKYNYFLEEMPIQQWEKIHYDKIFGFGQIKFCFSQGILNSITSGNFKSNINNKINIGDNKSVTSSILGEPSKVFSNTKSKEQWQYKYNDYFIYINIYENIVKEFRVYRLKN